MYLLHLQESTNVRAYLPSDLWYEFPSGVQMASMGGAYIDLDTPLSKINVHLRAGFILPMLSPGTNLMSSRINPFTLLVALTANGNASGAFYWDDGDSIGNELFFALAHSIENSIRAILTCLLFRFHREEILQLLRVFSD